MFITDYWYLAGWPSEVASKPLRRIIMNQPIVMFRCSDGTMAALEDRCSHRNFPLSKGIVGKDTLQCGYHGLTFDRHGACIYAPGQPLPPPRSDIRTYPIEERFGMFWVWMGDLEKADPALIPDLSWMEQKGWSSWRDGHIHLDAPDQFLAENLLDISHLAYVHKASMGSDPDLIAGGKIKVSIESYGVRRLVDFMDMPTPPVYKRSSLIEDVIDQRTESKMEPGLYQNHVVVKNSGTADWSGPGSDGDYPIITRSFHAIVPETDGSTHYFFGGAVKEIDVVVFNADSHKQILSEDVDVLESIFANEKLVGDRPTVNLRNDLAVMRWRTYLEERQPTGGSEQRAA